ncbi:MAG: hypothetical protein ACOCYG_01095 [Spirochaetota bacterium]
MSASSQYSSSTSTMRRRADEQYDRVYAETLDQLEYRLMRDEGFDARELREQLEVMYVQEGNDWLGRGMAEEMSMAATIAAMEAVLARLERNGRA